LQSALFAGNGKPWGGPGGFLESVDFGGRRTFMRIFDGVLALFFFSALACDRNVLRLVVGECTFKDCVSGILSDQTKAYKQMTKGLGDWMERRNQLAAEKANEKRIAEMKKSQASTSVNQGEFPAGSIGNPRQGGRLQAGEEARFPPGSLGNPNAA